MMGFEVAPLPLYTVIFAIVLLIGGIWLGWFVANKNQQRVERHLLDELSGLRVNYNYIREDAHELRVQLKQAETQNARLVRVLNSTSGHERFLKTRTELVVARKGIQALKGMVKGLKDENFVLKEKIYKLNHQLHTRPPVHPIALNKKKLLLLNDGKDNLQNIPGIDTDIERKLRDMGITSYRQLAEATPMQWAFIQKLAGNGHSLPLHSWTKVARQLFLEKYNSPKNDPHAFKGQHQLLRSSGSVAG